MSLLKTAVFLASRFEEFAELRKQLKGLITNYPVVQLTPIDLNDGNVSHRPPLAECLGYVHRAEFMILLLGDVYGSLAPKTEKSFTHLEYQEAIKEGAGTRVLVFGIGEHYRGSRIHYSEDERLAGWQRQIEENHTVGFFDPEISIEVIAKSIFDRLLAALYEMRFGALSIDGGGGISDDLFDAIEDDSLFDDTEISALEERNAREPSLVGDRARFANTLAAITQPAAVAALEQREEAQRALDIGEYGVAIYHLKRALEFKPLELISNYWLAQLYVALGRKEKALEAMEMAERAGRIAERDALPYRASAAYVIAARAAQLSGHSNEAINFAKQAVEIAPRFARSHIELARQYALHRENKAALGAIRQAFTLYPKSLREVFGDPVFHPMRKEIDNLIQEVKEKVARDVADLARIERDIAALAGKSGVSTSLEGKTISQLIEAGRQSSRRQYHHLCNLVDDAEQKMHEISAQAPKSPPATQELLRFNRPGRARVVEWFKHPGEIIQPEEAVFSFNFEGSTKVIPWLLRTRTAVRMQTRTGNNGAWISSENPYIFEHIPSSVPIIAPTRLEQLRGAIKHTETHVVAAKTKLAELNAHKDEATREQSSLQYALQQRGVTTLGIGMLMVGFVTVVIDFWLLYSGKYVVSVLFFAVALFLLSKGETRRNADQTKRNADQTKRNADQIKLDTLERSLTQIEQESSQYLAGATQGEQKLTSLRDELVAIEKDCEDAKMRAREALELFEGVSLRKGGRLLPFPSIFGAHAGDVVRVFERQLDQIKDESVRVIQLQDDLHEWLIGDAKIKAKTHLLRVVEKSQERLVLSHQQAYSLAKEGK